MPGARVWAAAAPDTKSSPGATSREGLEHGGMRGVPACHALWTWGHGGMAVLAWGTFMTWGTVDLFPAHLGAP